MGFSACPPGKPDEGIPGDGDGRDAICNSFQSCYWAVTH